MLVSCAGVYVVRSDLMQCQGMSTMEDCGVLADMAGVWLAELHHSLYHRVHGCSLSAVTVIPSPAPPP